MTDKNPLISILICNYNYAKYIRETLQSAVQQDYPYTEIIVVDDGSSDNSVEVVQKYIETRQASNIFLKAKKNNQGICYTRNDAIKQAKGEYILFLDSDDTIPANYISWMYQVALKKKAEVVYGDMKKFGDEIGETNFPDYDQDKLLLYNYINVSSLIKKSALNNHVFDTKLNRKTSEDYDFWLGLSLAGVNFAKASGIYLNYRIQKHSRNVNESELRARMLGFLEVWKYSITKYRKKYPNKIKPDLEYDQIVYQVSEVNKELASLNKVVHEELIPELDKRAQHINHLNQKTQELAEINNILTTKYDRLLASRDYRLGNLFLGPLRAIKRRVQNAKNQDNVV